MPTLVAFLRSGCYNPNVSFKKEANWAGYGVSLVIGTSPAGLYLYQLPPFHLAHPTLLVPWHDVHVGARSKSLLDGRQFSCTSVTALPFKCAFLGALSNTLPDIRT